MHLTLPFPEAVELALQGAALPPLVRSVACTGATIRADIDLRAVPSPPFALRAVAAVAPIVHVEATFRSFAAGAATFDLAVRAGSVPVQRVLNQLTGLLNSALRAQHVPDGLVTVRQGAAGELLAVLDLQAGVALRTRGVTLTHCALTEGVFEVAATVRDFTLRAT
ncbi:hypothetical protein [Pengzhenrongella sicca]|uniref:Uncharacterized protein n=1 Tax=Pengzhenrongella sicca TaxID=2819238 RepID=A0A8A4ZCP2_9MICO|nr:hypothetical protein [Pengzhenrongella sicca]QTE28789.1 hypothetical protein J4E96_15820 [Pengzhenrongella sicca]